MQHVHKVSTRWIRQRVSERFSTTRICKIQLSPSSNDKVGFLNDSISDPDVPTLREAYEQTYEPIREPVREAMREPVRLLDGNLARLSNEFCLHLYALL